MPPTLFLVGPGQPAMARTYPLSLRHCTANNVPQFFNSSMSINPNVLNPVSLPAGVLQDDVFRLQTTFPTTYRIDYWGTRKNINGELPVAPAGWPAPGLPKYMVIARFNQGIIYSEISGATFGANQWFPVGADSRCLLYHGPNNGATLQVWESHVPGLAGAA